MKLNDATKKNQTELNEQETETIKAQFYKKKKNKNNKKRLLIRIMINASII